MRTLLLLKGENQQLEEMERYLETRFQVTVVHRTTDAIQHIVEHRPEFALLSADFITAKSSWLLGVLNQFTGAIVFVERFSAKSLALTRELKGTYLLEPPLEPIGLAQLLGRIDRDRRLHVQIAAKLQDQQVLIMSALTDLALKNLCAPTPVRASGAGAEVVSRTSRVTSFRVQTKTLAGYLVLAYGQNRKLDVAFKEEMRARLKDYLTAFDAQAKISVLGDIQIYEVDFHEWSAEHAEFIRQAQHQESELVLAFLKDSAPAKLTPSPVKGHLQLPLEHLKGDQVVDFDLFIYLPKNAKFILYTPRGGTFLDTQKRKLRSEGIDSVHVSKRSLEDVHRHLGRNFLQDRTDPAGQA